MNKKAQISYSLLAFIFLASMAVFLSVYSLVFKISFVSLFNKFISGFFSDPHVNGFYGTSAFSYKILYYLLAVSFVIISSLDLARRRKKQQTDAPFVLPSFFRLLLIILALLSVCQVVQHSWYFQHRYELFQNKSLHQKKIQLFGFPYAFARNCQKHLSGYHRAQFITDVDVHHPEGMTEHRRLAYFLYPINIRSYDKTLPVDSIIYFKKHDAVNLIPEGYVIRYAYDNDNVLAVRKDLP